MTLPSFPKSRGLFVCGVLVVSQWLCVDLSAQAPNAFSPPVAASPVAEDESSLAPYAILGEPFGIARIVLPHRVPDAPGSLRPIEVYDRDGRVFYATTVDVLGIVNQAPRTIEPAAGQRMLGGGRLIRRVGELVRQATTDTSEPQIVSREVHFLFRGNEPLNVRLSVADAAGRVDFRLEPISPSVQDDHSIAMNRWWNGFTSDLKRRTDAADYPTVVEDYLVALLSGRLGMPLPTEYLLDSSESDPSIASTLKLLAGTANIRAAIFRRAAIGNAEPVVAADLPLPEAPRWATSPTLAPAAETVVERLAASVPPECFYIRYGSFENSLWFNDLAAEYGGDIGGMFAVRGSNEGSMQRIETQLHLKMTAMSRILGSSVIEDQAIVGRDLFLSEGASMGVMILAKNLFLVQTALNADRSALAKSDPELVLAEENILDQKVSFLRTLDNRVRSFMVVQGNTIFVTNSRTLAKRFIEVSRSKESLAATPEFRLARQLMPVDRGDTIFAYASPGMMQGLVSPAYLIELRRRLYASAEMSLVGLARLAAAAEGNTLLEPQELVDAGFLPRQFMTRADGSGLIVVGDTVIDSLRGRSGTMLPIADIEIDKVTAEEAAWYARIASYYEGNWPQLDPIFFGLRRSEVPDNPKLERLEMRAEIAPFAAEKYGDIAKQLGPPTRVKIDFAPDDIISGQAHVVSDQLGGSIPPHHLFAAIKDTTPPTAAQFDGFLKTYQALRELPGYVGAWPQPGLLDRLPLGLGRGQPVGPGMTRLIGGVYRFQGNGFSILSLQSEVLSASLPYLVASEAESSAQVRLQVGNLLGSQLEDWVNGQIYQQDAAKSHAGAELLELLTRQLRVSPQDVEKTAANLLGGAVRDPLGGTYSLVNVKQTNGSAVNETATWTSSAWKNEDQISKGSRDQVISTDLPPEYVAPILRWFRGGKAELTQLADRLMVDAVIDVERKRPQAAAVAR